MTTFYTGIDLGTSRTSMCTSTGKRITVDSCVGYPKDVIAQRRFGKSYLLGKDAIENRLALNITWPLADGIIESEKSIESVRLILDNLISGSFPDLKHEDKLYAAIGVPAQASIDSKKDILHAVENTPMDKVLIVSEPFMVAYGMGIFDESLIIDIGAGTVDLCRIHGTLPEPEDQISLTTAGNYLDNLIKGNLLGEHPNVQVTPKIIRNLKEKFGYADEGLQEAMFTFTEAGKPREYDVSNVVKMSVREMVKPICEAAQGLIADFDPEFQERLRNNIIVAGGGSRLRGIDRAVEHSLKEYGGGNVRCTEDAEFGGAIGALQMALEMPEDLWDKV